VWPFGDTNAAGSNGDRGAGNGDSSKLETTHPT
jgi:hypothetical protein